MITIAKLLLRVALFTRSIALVAAVLGGLGALTDACSGGSRNLTWRDTPIPGDEGAGLLIGGLLVAAAAYLIALALAVVVARLSPPPPEPEPISRAMVARFGSDAEKRLAGIDPASNAGNRQRARVTRSSCETPSCREKPVQEGLCLECWQAKLYREATGRSLPGKTRTE